MLIIINFYYKTDKIVNLKCKLKRYRLHDKKLEFQVHNKHFLYYSENYFITFEFQFFFLAACV